MYHGKDISKHYTNHIFLTNRQSPNQVIREVYGRSMNYISTTLSIRSFILHAERSTFVVDSSLRILKVVHSFFMWEVTSTTHGNRYNYKVLPTSTRTSFLRLKYLPLWVVRVHHSLFIIHYFSNWNTRNRRTIYSDTYWLSTYNVSRTHTLVSRVRRSRLKFDKKETKDRRRFYRMKNRFPIL